MASRIQAGNDVDIDAGQDINILSAQDERVIERVIGDRP
ncbi:hypothetical protein [Pseudomonas sp. PA15(2017)]